MAFLLGCNIATVYVHWRSRRNEDPRNSTIRGLEAEARLRDKRIVELEEELEGSKAGNEETDAQLSELKQLQQKSEEDVSYLKTELRESIAKTDELRNELTDRATEGVKDHLRLAEVRTELQVTKAGADAVFAEISRIESERDQLSSTVSCLKEKLAESMLSPELIDAELAQLRAEQPNAHSEQIETMVAVDLPTDEAQELAPVAVVSEDISATETVAEEANTESAAVSSDADMIDVEEFLGTDVIDSETRKD